MDDKWPKKKEATMMMMKQGGRQGKAEVLALHRLVWSNQHERLAHVLATQRHDLEEKDQFGRTPLRLAVCLQHKECVEELLDAGADVTTQDKEGWTAVHDATAAGNEEVLGVILTNRQFRLQSLSEHSTPQLLTILDDAPDFSVDLKWHFSSWVPFLSNLCPEDTVRIQKRGMKVRMDMTLLGFENMRWVRGNRTILLKAEPQSDDGRNISVQVVNIDHETRTCFVEHVKDVAGGDMAGMGPGNPGFRHELQARLSNPVATTVMDQDNVSFHKAKSGVWGFQRDRVDTVGDHTCQVYGTSGIEFVTKQRVEHLPASHPARKKAKASVMSRLLHLDNDDDDDDSGGDGRSGGQEGDGAQDAPKTQAGLLSWLTSRPKDDSSSDHDEDDDGDVEDDDEEEDHVRAAWKKKRWPELLTFDEYNAGRLSEKLLAAVGSKQAAKLRRRCCKGSAGGGVDVLAIGRTQRSQKQRFKPMLWMCDNYPLSLQEQVLPVFELLAPTNHHIAKLRDFISLRLPTGFPVQIELPLYRVITGRATFANFSPQAPEEDLFAIPASYRMLSSGDVGGSSDDAALARALQQGLHGGSNDNQGFDYTYEAELQRAIAASLGVEATAGDSEVQDPDLAAAIRASLADAAPDAAQAAPVAAHAGRDEQPYQQQQHQQQPGGPQELVGDHAGSGDAMLQQVLQQSLMEREQTEQERERREQEELERVMALSLQDK